MDKLLFFLVSLIATTAGAISGIGGGVIIKPVLDAVSTLGVSAISFLSGCTVLAMAIVSLLKSRGGGVQIDVKKSTTLAISAAIGGVLGKYIFDLIKRATEGDAAIGATQSALLIIITGGVFLYVIFKNKISVKNVQNILAIGGLGLGLGLLSSFLGIGGGPINIAVLSYFFAMDSKTCARNSIYIILFSQSASLITNLFSGNIPAVSPLLLILMVSGGIIGGFVGGAIGKKLDNGKVDKLFSVMMAVIILISAYNLVGFLF